MSSTFMIGRCVAQSQLISNTDLHDKHAAINDDRAR